MTKRRQFSDLWRDVSRRILVGALVLSIAAPWALLQTAAWMTMAVNYSVAEGSLVEGLSKTFDGDHPCELCRVAAEEAAKDREPAPSDELGKPMKLHWLLSVATVKLFPPPADTNRMEVCLVACRVVDRPELRPPIGRSPHMLAS
jgi:hypothetical protein